MTTAEPNRNDLDAGDSQDAQCLLYLLGELDAETSKRFEEKLAGNAELSEALLQQASLITAIAQSRAFDRRTLPACGFETLTSLRNAAMAMDRCRRFRCGLHRFDGAISSIRLAIWHDRLDQRWRRGRTGSIAR